ncbi:hypothetical protein VN97_g12896 [Penicillium thymicola]|uniref:Uncharacterized protein n=1 Tax=Penicillium thymicola TaxID=293382 RepID=A0AAI9T4Q4_PENTH|nr:hypothetical protein VN97_g12896 [Penicillium thymicola]
MVNCISSLSLAVCPSFFFRSKLAHRSFPVCLSHWQGINTPSPPFLPLILSFFSIPHPPGPHCTPWFPGHPTFVLTFFLELSQLQVFIQHTDAVVK